MSLDNATCTNAKCDYDFGIRSLGNPQTKAPAFCPQCGNGVIEKCPRCEHDLEPDEIPRPKFCEHCGQQLRFDPDARTGKVTVVLE